MPRDEEGMNKIAIFVSILVIVPPTWLLPDNPTTACQSFRKFWSYQEMYLSYLRNTFKHVLKIKKYQLLDYRMYSDKIKESLISPPQPPHSIKKASSQGKRNLRNSQLQSLSLWCWIFCKLTDKVCVACLHNLYKCIKGVQMSSASSGCS